MVIVGGAVSLAGDHIGRIFGKKRLKIGRLRPKHSAMVGTFIAGMLGTLATIIVIGIIAEPVRVWILEGDRARNDLIQTKKELGNAQSTLTDTQNQLSTTTQDLNSKNKEIFTKNEEIKVLADEARRRIAETDRLQQQTRELTTRTQRLAADLKQLAPKLTDLNEQIKIRSAELDKFQKDNIALQTRNFELIQDNSKLSEQITRNQNLTKKLNQDIEDLKEAAKRQEEDFDAQTKANDAKLNDLNKNLESKQSALNKAQLELDRATENLDTIQRQLTQATVLAGAARNRPLIFNLGDELARIEIPTGTSYANTSDFVTSLLIKARTEADRKGAGTTPQGQFAGLVPQGQAGSPQTQIAAISQLTAARNQPYLLIARSLMNTFEGEYVPVNLVAVPNKVIYNKDDVIISLQIDGRKSEAIIVSQIIEFLSQNLSQEAIKDGMIPATGKPNPLGEVTEEQILEMVSRVKAANLTIRFQILAAKETRAGDPLQVSFRLRP